MIDAYCSGSASCQIFNGGANNKNKKKIKKRLLQLFRAMLTHGKICQTAE